MSRDLASYSTFLKTVVDLTTFVHTQNCEAENTGSTKYGVNYALLDLACPNKALFIAEP